MSKYEKSHIVVRVLKLLLPYKRKFAFSVFVGIILALLSPLRPALVQLTVDKYIAASLLNMLVWISIIQFGIVLLEAWLRFYFVYIASWLGQHIIKDLRLFVFKKIINLNVRQFDKTPIGVFSTRTIDDAERINDIFSNGLLPVIVDIFSVLAILGYMFYTDVLLTLISLSPFPILIIATWFFKNSVKKSFNRVRNAVAYLNAFINEQLSGIYIIKSFVLEKSSLNKFNEYNEKHKKENINAIFAYSVFFPTVEIISALSIGMLIWWVADTSNSPGEIIAFILCINTIFRPLRVIADKFNTIQMGLLAAKRVFKVIDNKDNTPSGTKTQSTPLKGNIRFENVYFAYKDNNPVLKNISFELNQSQSLAIVGRTGSGKTTIISLLNRIYQHQQGKIIIDETKIEDYEINFLRSQIGYVSQNIFLFGGSIYENIAFANPSLTLQATKAICKTLYIDKIIDMLPGKYAFPIIEGGGNLSTGQRQLISIARVFALSPSIVVFDEATSSIDPSLEEIIDKAAESLLKNKSAIIIAHRYKTILKANKILVIEEGKIRAEGSHKQLLKKDFYYKDLFEKQNKQQGLINI